MPKILISESDFKSLSTSTQKELWEFFQKSFSFEDGDPPPSDTDIWISKVLKEGEKNRERESDWRERRNAIRSNSVNYQEYNTALHELHKDLSNFLPKQSSFHFDALSIETAIAVVLGLSSDSIKVLSRLVEFPRPATREELATILNGEGKINGTIGSINRRLTKRFDKDFYGESLKNAKLIEFDKNEYSLSCDSASLDIALRISKADYKIGKGNIFLKFIRSSAENKEIIDTLEIEEEAIKFADDGLGFSKDVSWDIHWTNEQTTYSYATAMTVPSAIIVVDLPHGYEWVSDNPDFDNLFESGITEGYPQEISFQAKSQKNKTDYK